MSNNLSKHTLGLTQLQSGQGAPSHQAPLGSLYINVSTSDYYKNTDGNTSWAVLITTGSTFTDNYVTGGTYSNGTLTLNRQNGSVVVTGFTTTTLSATSLNVDYIDFNQNYTGATAQGRINWDTGTGTLNIGVGSSGTSLIDLQVGQEEIVRVYNDAGSTLNKGEIVYVAGSQGQRPSVKRASAVGDGYSVTTLGMVDAAITSGAEGYVTTFGIISNLNTNAYTGGTPIWLSPTTPGGFTDVKPQAPYHTVLIGYVVRQHPSSGSIFVNISNGWELDELHDVRISGVTEGDLLIRSTYNGSNVWVNSKTLKGDYTISGNTNNIGDFSATTFYGSGSGLTNIPIAGVTNLQNSLDLKTDLSLFNSHTANTNNPHQTSFYQLISTAHTHTISDVLNLQTNLDLKFDKSGGTVNGNVLVLGNVTILGSATTINTQTLSIADNIITLNSNVTGGTPFVGDSGIEVLRGSATTATILWKEQNSQWEAGLQGTTKKIILEGDSLALLTSGHTHPISEINGLQTSLDSKTDLTSFNSHTANTSNPHQTTFYNLVSTAHTHTISDVLDLQTTLNNKFDSSGGTITGNVLVTGSVSATTFYGNGQYLTGLVTNDFYVTGGTFVGTTLTLNRQNGSVTITGFTATSSGGGTFTGGTVNGFTVFTNGLSANTISTPITNTQVVYSNNGTLTGSTNLTWTNSSALLTINGTLEATSKSFSIPHPTKEGKKLVYGSLEGPENGVYHRGKLYNEDTIILPEYWYKLVDKDTVTVQLTSIGRHQNLYVKEIFEDKVIIGIEGGLFSNKTINCYYVVYGERKDINKLEVER